MQRYQIKTAQSLIIANFETLKAKKNFVLETKKIRLSKKNLRVPSIRAII